MKREVVLVLLTGLALSSGFFYAAYLTSSNINNNSSSGTDNNSFGDKRQVFAEGGGRIGDARGRFDVILGEETGTADMRDQRDRGLDTELAGACLCVCVMLCV